MILPSVWTISSCGFCLPHFVLSTCEQGIVLTLFSENLRAVLGRSAIQENVFFCSISGDCQTAVGMLSFKPYKGLTFQSEDSKILSSRCNLLLLQTNPPPAELNLPKSGLLELNQKRCFNVVIFVFTGWLVNDHQSGSCECHLQNNNLQVLSRNSHWAVSCLTLKDTQPAYAAVFPRSFSLRNVRSGEERGATAVFTGFKTPTPIYLAFFRWTKTWNRGTQSPNWKFTACSS